jgi:drug/metabolite transporter (DMT)-like permease
MEGSDPRRAPDVAARPPARGPRRHITRWRRRSAGLSPTVRGLIWAGASGIIFSQLNALMRLLSLQLDPFQTQFLRYLFGMLVMLPLIWRSGLRAYMPKQLGSQFARGAVHTLGLGLWFIALPRISLADTTAYGFTGPIFIMIGAYVFFKEPMRWERWLAAAIGFAGVLIVLAPKLSGSGGYYNLVMLASSPVFAASFLLTKGLTRHETTGVIVIWQAISVTLFSVPLALWHWQNPTPLQWAMFAVCGGLGSGAHYCLTRSFRAADISSTQSVKFLDLIWATAMGWLMFGDVPTQSTLIGGTVICAATLWIARRESRPPVEPRGPTSGGEA